MDKLENRLAYLQGMAEGFGLMNTNEGRMITEIIKAMGDMAKEIETLRSRMDEQAEYVEAIDEDLADMEEYVEAIDKDLDDVENILFFDEDEDVTADEYDGEPEPMDLHEDHDDGQVIHVDGVYDELDQTEDDTGYVQVECPNCQELVSVDSDIFEDDMVAEVLCPECHEVILVNDDAEDAKGFENAVIDEDR